MSAHPRQKKLALSELSGAHTTFTNPEDLNGAASTEAPRNLPRLRHHKTSHRPTLFFDC